MTSSMAHGPLMKRTDSQAAFHPICQIFVLMHPTRLDRIEVEGLESLVDTASWRIPSNIHSARFLIRGDFVDRNEGVFSFELAPSLDTVTPSQMVLRFRL